MRYRLLLDLGPHLVDAAIELADRHRVADLDAPVEDTPDGNPPEVIARVEVRADARLPQHAHPHEQVTTVLSGELELTVAGEVKVLRPGMVAFIPGGVPHSARAITACQVLDVFHPVRDDYR